MTDRRGRRVEGRELLPRGSVTASPGDTAVTSREHTSARGNCFSARRRRPPGCLRPTPESLRRLQAAERSAAETQPKPAPQFRVFAAATLPHALCQRPRGSANYPGPAPELRTRDRGGDRGIPGGERSAARGPEFSRAFRTRGPGSRELSNSR